MTPRIHRVVVADDQPLIRAGFAMILAAEDSIELVGEASNGQEAVDLAHQHKPDVILMDVRMPVMNGIDATRLVADSGLNVAVLVLTTFDTDENVYGALQAGASGFLLKDTPPDDLVAAIRIVASGDALLSPQITRRLITTFAHQSGPATEPSGLSDLTAREREVLLLLAGGCSNAEIAERLFVGETTIKTHVGRVLTKLGVRDRVQAVIAAYESGLVRPGQRSQN